MGQKTSCMGAKMTKVFIIHGWTYTLDKWTELCQILTKNGIEPVQLHVPGLTASTDHPWDMAAYITWLHKQLEGEVRPVVIGHSNGGRIALNYAMHHPNGLGKIILIDSAGIYHGDLYSKTKRGVFKLAAKLGKPIASIPIAKKVFYRLIGVKDYYQASPHMQQTMKNMLAADRRLELDEIKTPVWLLWGKRDNATPLSDAYKLQKKLHHAPLDVIVQAGHSPHATHASQVAKLITGIVIGKAK